MCYGCWHGEPWCLILDANTMWKRAQREGHQYFDALAWLEYLDHYEPPEPIEEVLERDG